MDAASQKSIHHKYLSGGLSRLKACAEHTDTIVIVEDTRFPCHRTVLAAMSTYFQAMFNSGMKESQERIVTLKGISPTSFEKILDFIYTGDLELSHDNVIDILQTASMYQISALQLICEKFLARDICLQNSILYWRLALTYSCSYLEDRSFSFMTDCFNQIVQLEEFLDLTKDELLRYINAECLNADKEEDVCEAVLSWIEHDRSRRSNNLLEVMQNLRFPLMDASYLNNLTSHNPIIRSNENCQDFVKRASNINQNYFLTQVNPRAFTPRKENALIMVDGRHQEVCCFSLQSKKLYSLAKFPYFSNTKAACVHDEDIFVSGGSDWPNQLVRFVTEQNRWEKCCNLQHSRLCHTMVSVGDYVYVLGGFSPGRKDKCKYVEKYDPAENKTSVVGEIAYLSQTASASALGKIIYIFGGSCDEEECLENKLITVPTVFHSYNTETNTSCTISVLHSVTVGSQILNVDETLYIFSPNGNVLTLSENSSPTISHVLRSLEHRHFRVVYHLGWFYILPLAAPKYHEELLVLALNLQTGEEHVLLWEKLPRTLPDSHWMKVTLSKQHLCYEFCRR